MSAASSRPSTPSNLSKPNVDPSSHPACKLIARAHPNDEAKVTQIFADKIAHKPLILSSSGDHADKRAARRHLRLHKKAYAIKHARPKPLSAKEKRELGLYELRPEDCKYSIYLELNALWKRYILEVLGFLDRDGKVIKVKVGSGSSANGAGALIASADFHGMEVEVVRCVDVGRVGLKGIVVRETRSTFTIVCDEEEDKSRTKKRKRPAEEQDDPALSTAGDSAESTGRQDKVRMILKKGTVFRVVIDLPRSEEAPADTADPAGDHGGMVDVVRSTTVTMKRQLIFELHGDQLEIRPIERATKKFKWRSMDYL